MLSAARDVGGEVRQSFMGAELLRQDRCPDIMFEYMMESGETTFMNNDTILHSRTALEDFPVEPPKRHLLRLWLDVPNGRPVGKIDSYHGTAK